MLTADTRTRINTTYSDANCTVVELEEMTFFALQYPGVVVSTNLGAADVFGERLVTTDFDTSLSNFESDFEEAKFRKIFLDGITLFISDEGAEAPDEVSDFFSCDMPLTRQ